MILIVKRKAPDGYPPSKEQGAGSYTLPVLEFILLGEPAEYDMIQIQYGYHNSMRDLTTM
jgi:hypothetical protein